MNKQNIFQKLMSTFTYYPQIWMFVNRTANNLINNTHKYTLQLFKYPSQFIKTSHRT